MFSVEAAPFLHSANVLRRALTVLLVLLGVAAVIVLWWLILAPADLGQTLSGFLSSEVTPPGTGQSIGLAALLLIQLGLWIAVVWNARSIFSSLLVADGERASDFARRTAQLLWVMLVWSVLAHALGSVISSWHMPEGQRTLSIGIGSAQITTFMAALLASFTAHAFALGAALWQDTQEII